MATAQQGPQAVIPSLEHMEKDGCDLMSEDTRNLLRRALDDREVIELNIAELRETLGIRPCVHCGVSIAVLYKQTREGYVAFAIEHDGKLHPKPCKQKGVAA